MYIYINVQGGIQVYYCYDVKGYNILVLDFIYIYSKYLNIKSGT